MLHKRHLQEIENIKQDFSRESESMMSEFTEAQEILKDKISELQIMYVWHIFKMKEFLSLCSNLDVL